MASMESSGKKLLQKITFKRLLAAWFLCLLALVAQVMYGIASYPSAIEMTGRPAQPIADAAIVLGAAVWNKQPSPVFEERIKHGLDLYKTGQVSYLIFTGGTGAGNELAESAVARRYAVEHGIPDASIFSEEISKNTFQNLLQSCRIMHQAGLHSVLIVSDPMHMKRAMSMAAELKIQARAAATPSSRYINWKSKTRALVYESFYFITHVLTQAWVSSSGCD